jgi:hypothetical protein
MVVGASLSMKQMSSAPPKLKQQSILLAIEPRKRDVVAYLIRVAAITKQKSFKVVHNKPVLVENN